MKNTITYSVAFALIISLFCCPLNAQQLSSPKEGISDSYVKNKRVKDYLELRKLGYEEKAIFQDLGNAHFLAENFETALFWYERLKAVSAADDLSEGFQKRYDYALVKTAGSGSVVSMDEEDWLASIKADYGVDKPKKSYNRKFKPLDSPFEFEQKLLGDYDKELKGENGYNAPVSLTADGNTAYFSKSVYVKPPIGLFSKKEMVHKIYKAEKKNGKWGNIREVSLCPKYYSALHPAVSYDGKRLFFTSDMPGSYGNYDIYVADIGEDGSLGVAKNLGGKVNTKKNEMYPKIIGGNTLFFASNGRKGLGGLDVYMTQVNDASVGLAVNLGDTLNSREDDYAIRFMPEKSMAYIVSSRGHNEGDLHQVAFSYDQPGPYIPEENTAYNVLQAINNDAKMDYSSSVFEDE
ncbi:cell envelope biogenesis protein OmpA [Maribacter polysaccharolyticus]|uniref:cell envelope biogenesis protein OmpA n=1 Tax=Maribacter polysaccharolyticus TaxID=3020831 RepID=UPI00237F21DB|nr:cell envelope biogenesis protein OmpA [Maribacter polysaccharolyticus]MDE3742834.1 cell envelope biogenesis protein OmpA [Maribacter polysaccharolyticus]